MTNEEMMINLYNGLDDYANKILGVSDSKIDYKNTIYAALSLLSLEFVLTKDELIEKGESLSYKSNLSDRELDSYKDVVNSENKSIVFNTGEDLFIKVRNKMAHGDFYVDIDNNKLYITIEDEKINFSLDNFIKFFINYFEIINYRINDDEFKKTILLNKGNLKIKKEITSKEELDKYMNLYKNITITSKRIENGKKVILSTTEKELISNCLYIYLDFINLIANVSNGKNVSTNNCGLQNNLTLINSLILKLNNEGRNITSSFTETKKILYDILGIRDTNISFITTPKTLSDLKGYNEKNIRNAIINDLGKLGYITDISYSPVKCDMDKLFNRIKFLNNQGFELKQLIYLYGESINKLTEYKDLNVIKNGLFFPLHIIPLIFSFEGNDFETILHFTNPNFRSEFYYNRFEVATAIELAHFYAMFCYPFDKLLDRGVGLDNLKYQLPFNLLDFSSLKPNIINLSKKEIEQLIKRRDSLEKSKISALESIKKEKQNLENVKLKRSDDEELINKLDSKYKEKLEHYKTVNDEYFKVKETIKILNDCYKDDFYYNRAIITGIRNSISHGGVIISNMGEINNIYDLVLTFNDIYEGETVFSLTVTFKDFIKIFNKNNINILNNYFNYLKTIDEKENEKSI